MPKGLMTETWMQPRDVAGLGSQWRAEVKAARRLGRRVGDERYLEVRYEDLVGDVESVLRRVSTFARLAYEPAMGDYAGDVDRLDQTAPAKPQAASDCGAAGLAAADAAGGRRRL